MKQRDIFLQSEGDAWFRRNRVSTPASDVDHTDPLGVELQEILASHTGCATHPRVLEIGCADGARLSWLRSRFSADCAGIEPSGQAVAAARQQGLDVRQATADSLPFDDNSFDIVIFGFCLYLCDRDDLVRIAAEADRVLHLPGWLLIMDFFSPVPEGRPYRHHHDVRTYKMDYRTLFDSYPAYQCVTHKVRHHETHQLTDDRDEWVAVSVLRKHVP